MGKNGRIERPHVQHALDRAVTSCSSGVVQRIGQRLGPLARLAAPVAESGGWHRFRKFRIAGALRPQPGLHMEPLSAKALVDLMMQSRWTMRLLRPLYDV